jgi:hypothetical protein
MGWETRSNFDVKQTHSRFSIRVICVIRGKIVFPAACRIEISLRHDPKRG